MNWGALRGVLWCAAVCAAYGQDDPEARWRYFYDQRRFPYAQIPEGARLKALRALERMNRAPRSALSAAPAAGIQGQWKLIGPQPISFGAGYISSGRVSALAVDPRDNDVVYAGGAQGGVWKTTDGGTTWIPLTDDQPSLATGSIAIDPSNPDTIYVGTGEENFSGDSYYGAGILKSTDGGATWTNIVGPFLRQRIGELAVHPADGKTILATTSAGFGTPAGTATGLYRSTDAGLTWTRALAGVATGVFFDPNQPDIAWAALGNVAGSVANGVYRSTDAGATWAPASGTAPNALPSPSSMGRIAIANNPTRPDSVYAAISNPATGSGASLNGIFRTNDAGKTWTKLASPVPDICGSNQQCWYDLVIRPHPKDPSLLFAGGIRPYRPLDGGATSWQQLSWIPSGNGTPHDDQHVMVFTNDGTRLYNSNDGGVWSTDVFQNSTIVWNNLNATLGLTQFYGGQAIHPTNPQIGLAGAQDNGSQRYGGQLQWDLLLFADGGWAAIDQSSPNIAYATFQNISVWRTLHFGAGNDFISVTNGINQSDRHSFIASFVIDPSNPRRMYYGTFRLYRSVDGGGLWTPISADLTDSRAGLISAIAVSPANPNVIYTGASTGAVFQSTDGGNSWNDRSLALPIRAVTQVAADPIDPFTVYITFSGFAGSSALSGHIYKSTDGGNNWTDMSGNLPDIPVNDLAIDPDLPNTFYAGTDLGVMVTTDGGTTWNPLGAGLPKVAVFSLALHRSSRTLRAATHGRSMWDYSLDFVPSSRPVIGSISPSTKNAGDGAFTLTIAGTNLGPGMHVFWNGQDRTVTVATATSLSVQIPAGDIQGVGRAAVTVFNPAPGGGASIPANFVIGPAPVINAMISGTNVPTTITASPGALVSLYGANLAASLVQFGTYPWPQTLGGVSVSVGAALAPLYYVSPGQLAFQVPFSVRFGVTQQVTVSQGTQVSASASLTVAAVSPSLFSTNQQGSGQGAIRIANSATIAAPVGAFPDSRPAQHGEFIEIYCTGLGGVTPAIAAGAAAPAITPARTILTPTVTIGGLPANVNFSGLAPGAAGLYQVNAQIPDGVAPASAVPVVVTINNVMSNTVTVAVE